MKPSEIAACLGIAVTVAVTLALALPACGGSSAQSRPDAAPPFYTEAGVRAEAQPSPEALPSGTCGTTGCPSGFTCSASGFCKTAGGVPQIKHVFVIYMENHGYSSIIGNLTSAPYENQLASQYVNMTNYFDGYVHPSLPNYLVLTAGTAFGVSSDCGATCCPQSGPDIATELDALGKTWHAYAEDMPSNCFQSDCGNYAVRHNPLVYYTDITTSCMKNDVPYGTNGANLTADLAKGGFDYVSITPNLCDDTHDSCSSDQILQGDQWLQANVPLITGSSEWKDGGVLFIVWDEGDGCSDQVPNLILSPMGKPGFQSTTKYDHFAMLATIEDGLGVPRLGMTAGIQPITDIWR